MTVKNSWFYRPDETREDFAKRLVECDKTAFIDFDGIAKCRYCKAPKMYHLKGDYGVKCDKWVSIACKCNGEPPKKLLRSYDGECPF